MAGKIDGKAEEALKHKRKRPPLTERPIYSANYGLRGRQIGSDAVEGGRQVRADELQRADNGNSDKRSDQAVFDGRRAGLVAYKTRKKIGHENLHLSDTLENPSSAVSLPLKIMDTLTLREVD